MLLPLLLVAAAGALLLAQERGRRQSTDTVAGRGEPSPAELERAYRAFARAARDGQLEPTSITDTAQIATHVYETLPEPERSRGLGLSRGLLLAHQQGLSPNKVKQGLTGLIAEACCLGLGALPPAKRKQARALGAHEDLQWSALIDWLLAQYSDPQLSPHSSCPLVMAHKLLDLFALAFTLPNEATAYNGLKADEHFSHWKLASLKSKQSKYNQWLREKINRWAKESHVTIPHRERTCPTLEYLEKIRTQYLDTENAEQLSHHLKPLLRAIMRDKMVPWLPLQSPKEQAA